MEYIKGIKNYKINTDKKAAVTIGKMDALHRGHKLLTKNIMSREDMISVVIIFSISPRIALKKETENTRFLITDEERAGLLASMGIDVLLEFEFNEDTIKTEPEDFVELLYSRLNMGYLCVGEDFCFGYRKRGDIGLLSQLSKKLGFIFEPVKKLTFEGEVISSSRIRKEVAAGNVRAANEMLGYSFFLDGTVKSGQRIGRTIGIPTVNIVPKSTKLLPPFGVYATKTTIDDREYPGMTNIGMRPTVNSDSSILTCETNIFDYSGDLYGKDIRVSFIEFIRPEKKFESLLALKEQIGRDKEAIQAII